MNFQKYKNKSQKKISSIVNMLLEPLGIKLVRFEKGLPKYPVDASERDIEIIKYILNSNWDERLSMVTVDRLMSLIKATRYIIENDIKGDFVECGVWRGGCALAIAMILKDYKVDRKIYLYDTFEGMTTPGKEDENFAGINPFNMFKKRQRETYNKWCYSSLEDVKYQFKKCDLGNNVIFVKGDVLKTLKKKDTLPEKIALLRLDTDWYASTKIEMEVLYPRIVKKGILLIDDYTDWKGCKRAVDEYFYNNFQSNYPLMWGNRMTGKGLVKI